MHIIFQFILGQSKTEFHTLQDTALDLTGMLISYTFFHSVKFLY